MIKKRKLVFFIIAAVVFNMLLTLICFAILLPLYSFFVIPRIPQEPGFFGFPLVIVISLALSFFIYQRFLALYLKKHSYPGLHQ